jgi:hypothetical protein
MVSAMAAGRSRQSVWVTRQRQALVIGVWSSGVATGCSLLYPLRTDAARIPTVACPPDQEN